MTWHSVPNSAIRSNGGSAQPSTGSSPGRSRPAGPATSRPSPARPGSPAPLARTHTELNQLKEGHQLALSALAAKDDELQRLRRQLSTFGGMAPPPVPGQQQGDDATGVVPLHRA